MFTLSEIKDIRRKYKLNGNGGIESTGKEKVKDVSKMTAEEKSYIESALFLDIMVTRIPNEFNQMSEEEFLEQMQVQFTEEALKSNSYAYGVGAIGSFQRDKLPGTIIWKSILNEQVGAMTYFNRVLAENGKRMQLFQRNYHGFYFCIKYSLVDDGKAKIRQDLNPNNSMYTKNPEPKILTPEQRQTRRKFVNRVMQVYRQYESDADYENRVKTEEYDMNFINDIQRSKGRIEILAQNPNSLPRVMNLLYAARKFKFRRANRLYRNIN